jgi:hypothetical protein
MATKQQVNDFINTAPESGEARFLWSGSTGADTSVTASVVGMTISIFDCNGNSRAESISNLSLFTIGSDTLSTFNKQDKTNYFYYEVVPTVTGSLADAEGACTETSLTPPPKITTFKNSEYNAVFNNAVNIRRIQRYETGSSGFSNGVFELVKTNSQLTPQNLNAVMSGSAATASFQESNIYSKSWTLPRYEGSKLSSGSLFYNDPALSFKGFNAIKYKLTESSSAIRSQSNIETELFYFNPPFATLRSGLRGYFQGSETDIPPSSQPVYELVGKEFKRITKSKLYLPNTDDVIRVEGYQAFYEANPSTNPGVQSGDNIFTVMIETLDNQDFYRYYNESNSLVGPFELRAGDGADVIKVSGSYIASLNEYALDVIDSGRTNAAIINDGRNELTNVKTFYEILSSSNNLL